MKKETYEKAEELLIKMEFIEDVMEKIKEISPYTLDKEARLIVDMFGEESVIKRLEEKMASLQSEFDAL